MVAQGPSVVATGEEATAGAILSDAEEARAVGSPSCAATVEVE